MLARLKKGSLIDKSVQLLFIKSSFSNDLFAFLTHPSAFAYGQMSCILRITTVKAIPGGEIKTRRKICN